MIEEQTEDSRITINGVKIELIPKIKEKLLPNINISSFRSLSKDMRQT